MKPTFLIAACMVLLTAAGVASAQRVDTLKFAEPGD